MAAQGFWGNIWMGMKMLRLIDHACQSRKGHISGHRWFALSEMRTLPWGLLTWNGLTQTWVWGEEAWSMSWLSLSTAKGQVRRLSSSSERKRQPLKARTVPSFQNEQAQIHRHSQVLVQQVHTGCCASHFPKLLCRLWHWRADTEPVLKARHTSTPGLGEPQNCLGSFGDPGVSAANKLWHKAASSVPSSLALPGPHLFPYIEIKITQRLQVTSLTLSHRLVLNTWVCSVYFSVWLSYFAFLLQSLQQGAKQVVCL
jgi:hypothetical protein